MSAYIVENDHIDAMLTYAARRGVSYYWQNQRILITRFNAEEIGRELMAQNERSVMHRYPGDDITDAAARYQFNPMNELMLMEAPRAAAWILAACDCLDYQSSETDDYQGTLAHVVTKAIQSAAIAHLPKYDAPWGITRDKLPADIRGRNVVCLTDLINKRR